MTIETDELETQIRAALLFRANSFPEGEREVPDLPRDATKRRRSTRVLAFGAAATVLVAGAFTWWILRSTEGDQIRVHSGSETTSPPSPPTTLPAAVIGEEVPLTEVTTDETDRLVALTQRFQPDASFVVVQTPQRAPVVVYHTPTEDCMTIAAPASVAVAGAEGSCGQRGLDQIIGATDTGPIDLPTTIAYGVWAHVPEGSAYVTWTYGAQRAWQRPIKGVSSFTIDGFRPPLGPEPVTMRAYDERGNELGHAIRTPYQDGSGQWAW